MGDKIDVGTLVRLRSGEDGLVLGCVATRLGFREFSVLLLDSGEQRRVTRPEFHPIQADDGEESMVTLLDDAFDGFECAGDPPARFVVPLDDGEIDSLADSRLSKTTKQQTKWAVRAFTEWLMFTENQDKLPFEDLDEECLAELLRGFYFGARSKKGERYSRSALKNLRAGLQRHLQSAPHNKQYNIMHDRTFLQANQVYDGYMSKIREEGRDKSQNKATIEPGDVKKLYASVFQDTPVGLQFRVFYEICFHFGRRGREGLRELRKDSFVFRKNDNGDEYVEQSYHEKEKTKRGMSGAEKEKEGLMFAMPGDANCPVLHLRKYLGKLHPSCEALFQRPKKVYDASSIWYDNIAVGHHPLNGMMKKMSEVGGLSQPYTNHCIRKTCVTALGNAGFEAQDIMSITGHKSVSSLQPYIGETSMSKKKKMSHALHSYRESTEPQPSTSADYVAPILEPSTVASTVASTTTATVTATTATSTITNTGSSSFNESSSLATVDMLQCSQSSDGGNMNVTKTAMHLQQRATGSLFAGAVLNNCTFNISFGN